ncbi:MAG: DUF853 domain-containing protein, partial [Clostridia bacterium]|nr:DUF853 domain-containing protein [Clostridia bacterium]
ATRAGRGVVARIRDKHLLLGLHRPLNGLFGRNRLDQEAEIMADDLYGKYEEARDDESAYEIIKAKEETQKAESESEKAEDKKEKTSSGKTTQKKTTKTTRKNTAASKVTNSLLNTVGRELGKSIARGILGLIKR